MLGRKSKTGFDVNPLISDTMLLYQHQSPLFRKKICFITSQTYRMETSVFVIGLTARVHTSVPGLASQRKFEQIPFLAGSSRPSSLPNPVRTIQCSVSGSRSGSDEEQKRKTTKIQKMFPSWWGFIFVK